jgi:HPt (histidine-containing phosphotransfer) domain-containing protein
MGDTEAMASLVHEYVAQTEEHITILEKVFAEEDRAAVEATAHLIKGSSRSITANRLADIAEEIEMHYTGEPVQTDAGNNAVVRLRDEFRLLKQRLLQEGYTL